MWWEKREVMELKTLSTRLRMRCLKRSTSGPLAARGVTPVAHFHVNAVELAQTVFNPVAGKARIGIKLGSRRQRQGQRQGQRLQAALNRPIELGTIANSTGKPSSVTIT